MTQEGWIKIHRQILSWEWYDDLPVFKLFMHLLLIANWERTKWHGKTLKAGQLVTSLNQLSDQTKLSVQNVRTALNKLKSSGNLTIKATNKNSIITITNYECYQVSLNASNMQTNNPLTNNQQTTNTLNNKRNKEEKNINIKKENTKRKKFVKPTFQEVQEYCSSRRNGIDPEQFVSYYESCGWMVGRNQMKDWRAAVRTWERNNRNYHTTTSPDNRRGTEVPTSPNYEQGL